MKTKLVPFLLILFYSLWLQSASAALPDADSQGKPLPSLAPMLKNVIPAVVNISTASKKQYRNNPLLNDPFFRRFFNVPDQRDYWKESPQKQQRSAGSGVIVDAAEGIIMTNFHVVDSADEVQVSLIDGRHFKAEVIGTDPEVDIAVLKIDADGLTQISVADSGVLEVGDFVVAIGNPFGLGQTVTTGIVSALGRSGLGIESYENFIQTDASINPGNSGGALVNLKGELVGLNTAIIASGGGNVGIGFAIPVNMAKASMEQIVQHGEVRRGQIGIGIQDITPDLAAAFDLENGQTGVLVARVLEGSPAEDAGLKSGDIVLEVDGKEVRSSSELRNRIGMKTIGEEVNLKLLRNGDKKAVSVKVGEPKIMASADEKLHPLLAGVKFENSPNGNGVRITALAPESAAMQSGLQTGDVIVSANRQPVSDLNSLRHALERNKKSVLLQINRNGGSLFVVIQ
jgi:Do/DeqQ family serine protease